jgi:hypothetical protein
MPCPTHSSLVKILQQSFSAVSGVESSQAAYFPAAG